LKHHELYLAPGVRQDTRLHIYRELFRQALKPEQVHDIRTTVQTGRPLGNDFFRQQVELVLDCKVGQAQRGRPRLQAEKGTDTF